MVKFRQKEFIAPAVLAALIGAGGTGASIIGNNATQKKANESQERIARLQQIGAKKDRESQKQAQQQQIDLQKKQLKAAQKQEDKIVKISKKDPAAAAAIKPTITVNTPQQPSQSNFSIGNYINSDVIAAGLGTVSTATQTIGSVRQQKIQNASNERIAAQENANKALETKAKIQENNNNTAIKMQELKNENNKFNKTYKLAKKSKKFSAVKEGAGFAKNLGTIAKGRGLNKVLAGAAVAGAVTGTGSYLVDKAIQKNAKKSGILKIEKPEETEEEKTAKKKKRNKKLLILTGTGAILTGSGIAAKKGKLGSDMKDIADKITIKAIKNKAKSGAETVKEATKDYFAPVNKETGKRKVDKLSLALTGLSTAAPAVMYIQKKKQLKDQIKQSESDDSHNSEEKEKTYSKIKINPEKIKASIKKAATKGEDQFFRGRNKEKYEGTVSDAALRVRANRLYAPKGRTQRYKVKDWIDKFKNKPGETLLDTLSFRTGGGGKKGVREFGNDLVKIGKDTGNETSQKVGKFIKKHPKTAMVGSAALGYGVIRKAKNKLSGATSKVIEKIDPDAYAYAKYGAKPIGFDNNSMEDGDE